MNSQDSRFNQALDSASEGRLLLPTFEEAVMRLAFVHAHLSSTLLANAAVAAAPLIDVAWLSQPPWLTASKTHVEAISTLMERAATGSASRRLMSASKSPFVPPLLTASLSSSRKLRGTPRDGGVGLLSSSVPSMQTARNQGCGAGSHSTRGLQSARELRPGGVIRL